MSETEHQHESGPNKDALIKRLHRIGGQVPGLERMLKEDRDCIDILTQVAAVVTALESLGLEILDDPVNHCLTAAVGSGDSDAAEQKSKELLETVRRFSRAR